MIQRINISTSSRKINITLTVDDTMLHGIRNLQSIRRVKAIARSAVNSATRVVARELTGLVKAVRTPQTTGATSRSISIKTGVSRQGNAYGVVAPDLRYIENHIQNRGIYKAWARKRGLRVGYTRQSGRLRNRFRYVKSFYRQSRRRLTLKRRPGKYWHLINDGFRHRFGRNVLGYEFVANAGYRSETAAREKMVQIWTQNVDRIIFGPDPGFKE